jgi:hypothetical protein
MHPAKVVRERVRRFTDLPNIGKAAAGDFMLLGFKSPAEITGQDPLVLYHDLCRATGVRQDPCVLDVFISVTRFLGGESPKLWWEYTEERKRVYGRV